MNRDPGMSPPSESEWEWDAAAARWLSVGRSVGHVECCGDGPLFFLGNGDSSLFFGKGGITLQARSLARCLDR